LKILVFLGGTTLIDRNLIAPTREEMVRRSIDRDKIGGLSGDVVPIGGCVSKLRRWKESGAEIVYFSATRKPESLEKTKLTAKLWGFPGGEFYFRGPTRSYAEVAEEILPDVIVEDDCESIGGKKEMIYPNLKPEFRARISSIVVKEFEGIDHLPDDPQRLIGGRK
jgi:hypothetical protein